MPIPTMSLIVIILVTIIRLTFATVDATINGTEFSEPVAMHISQLLIIVYSIGVVCIWKLIVYIYWRI